MIAHGRLPTSFLRRNRGPFEMAAIVDIGKAIPRNERPEVEDHTFYPALVARSRIQMDTSRFWKLLEGLAAPTIRDIFGTELSKRGSTCTVEPGQGSASLGCLSISSRPVLYRQPREDKADRIGIRVCDPEFGDLDLPVSDIRLFGDDHVTPNNAVIEDVAAYISKGGAVILSVGLTRPFAPQGGSEAKHWLQVNNIHRGDNPTWRLD